MITALIGMRSEVTSENFHYVFPWEFASHLSNAFNASKKATNAEEKDFHCVANEEDDEERAPIDSLKSIVGMLDEEEASDKIKGNDKGVQAFKLDDGNVIFVTQVASYLNRGPNFKDYSPIDFFSIVEIKKEKESKELEKEKEKEK